MPAAGGWERNQIQNPLTIPMLRLIDSRLRAVSDSRLSSHVRGPAAADAAACAYRCAALRSLARARLRLRSSMRAVLASTTACSRPIR